MARGVGRPRLRGKAALPPEIIKCLESKLARLAAVVCTRVDQLCALFEGKGEPSRIAELASELDRITRWIEKLRKLVSDGKPPEAEPGYASLKGLDETLAELMTGEDPQDTERQADASPGPLPVERRGPNRDGAA